MVATQGPEGGWLPSEFGIGKKTNKYTRHWRRLSRIAGWERVALPGWRRPVRDRRSPSLTLQYRHSCLQLLVLLQR